MPTVTTGVNALLTTTGTTTAHGTLTKALQGAVADAARIGAEYMPGNALLLNASASVTVSPSGTDAQRGTALVAAYAAAKLLTPNGVARSATNRACVVLPPGKYKTSNFQLDAEFIDIIPLVWEKPTRIQETDYLGLVDEIAVDLSTYRPGSTVIYSDVDYVSTIVQLADDVRIGGLTISHLGIGVGFISDNKYLDQLDWGALLIGNGSANLNSQYVDLYCWCWCTAFPSCGAVRAYDSFSGTWINCVANGASFRNGWGNKVAATAVFSATMTDCEGMPFSFIGDYLDVPANFTIGTASFTRCKGIGYTWEGSDGEACFAGCNQVSVAIPSTMICVDCKAGQKSFGIGNTNAGQYIRCRAGKSSFGSSNGGVGTEGTFSGTAEDCVAGAGSFGGNDAGAGSLGKCTGTLTRCTITGNEVTMRLEGAKIRDCRITATTTGIHLLTLLDSASVISNSDLIVLQGGTGVPFYAATAKSAAIYDCRMNNATNDADGLNANVTNLVTTAYNVVSNAVK